MTLFQCHCGEVHDSATHGVCAVTINVDVRPPTPDEVGREIRRLLTLLHAPGHTLEDEFAGRMNYDTDELRRQALDRAGICWLAPGEMAPGCACPWSPEAPEGPRLALEERMEENRRLWDDECITRTWSSRACERGTKTCVVKHRTK